MAKGLNDVNICVKTQQFVGDQLKTSGSTKFPSCEEGRVERLGKNVFRYSSYVDLKNSSGALLRKNYAV